MKILPATLTPEQRKKRITTIIVVICLALMLVVGLVIYFAGKRKGALQNTITLSNPLTPDGSAPSASEAEIRIIAENLHTDMDGLNAFGHDIAPWNAFLATSDADFIRVNNQFNSTYQVESGESLVSWVDNESGNGQFYTIKPIVQARFAKLNIK